MVRVQVLSGTTIQKLMYPQDRMRHSQFFLDPDLFLMLEPKLINELEAGRLGLLRTAAD